MNMGSGLCETGSRGGSLKMLSAVFGKSRGVTRSQTPPPQRQQASINRSACVQDAPMGSASEAAVSTSSAPCDGHGLTQPSISYGLPTDLGEHYELGHVLGQGGNAVVVRAISRRNAKEYACKCLPKVLKDPSASDLKRAGHQQALRRELDAVRRLSGALNVAAFEAAFEDDDTVYILTELCKGGELWHRIGEKHYSERTVASYMRAVLRTLAQFHSHHLLHRDVKPGNFLLLSEDDASPLRAIDFGLAVHFDPDSLPRSDLGLEGTPWYMAPEVLSSAVVPASDVWSAGVMAHQLLTGRFPFDDRANRAHPAISKIWQSILLDKVDFKRSAWDGISQEARDFVGALLQKDPAKRPTAKQALKHPWLKGSVAERSAGRPLSLAVVQRIQRYGQSSLLKRSALEFIAEEMLAAKTAQGDEQSQQGAGEPDQAAPTSCPVAPGGRPIVTSPSDSPLEFLYAQLSFAPDGTADRGQLSSGLQRLGYKLEAGEAERLLDAVDTGHTGRVAKGQFAASQIDWGALQRDRAAWLARARSAFEAIDADGDGVCGVDEIVACLARKLPLGEVGAAVRDCMAEAAKHEDSVKDGLSFEQFLRMLRADSRDSLDQYDDRMGGSLHGGGSSCGGSVHGGGSCRGGSHLAALLDRSVRAGEVFQPIKALDPVAEAA